MGVKVEVADFVSISSGYWDDPSIWNLGSIPGDGDTVTISPNHTVIFNVDQSSFTVGIAGLTVNGTLKIPSKDEDNSIPDQVYLKVDVGVGGTGLFAIGSPTYPIPPTQTVTVKVKGNITVAVFNCYGWVRLETDGRGGGYFITIVDEIETVLTDEAKFLHSFVEGVDLSITEIPLGVTIKDNDL